jgi:hypothetical protein
MEPHGSPPRGDGLDAIVVLTRWLIMLLVQLIA